MGEIIEFRERQAERRLTRARAREHENLQRAVEILKESLAAAADQLRSATETDCSELLDRIEKLAAMVRYGMRMLEGSSQLPYGNKGSGT